LYLTYLVVWIGVLVGAFGCFCAGISFFWHLPENGSQNQLKALASFHTYVFSSFAEEVSVK